MFRNNRKYPELAIMSDTNLMRIQEGIRCIGDFTKEGDKYKNPTAKRLATFYLNQRAGKHKLTSDAQRRALLLGQIKCFTESTAGQLRSLSKRVEYLGQLTDINYADRINLDKQLGNLYYIVRVLGDYVDSLQNGYKKAPKTPYPTSLLHVGKSV